MECKRGDMAETIKTQYRLSDDAHNAVTRHCQSEKKRGEWVSKAILEYDRMLTINEAENKPCGTLEQLAALIERLEQRIIRLDSRMPA